MEEKVNAVPRYPLCPNATDLQTFRPVGSLKHRRPVEDSNKKAKKQNKTQQNHQRQRERKKKKITILCTEFTRKSLTQADTRGSAPVRGWVGPTRSTFVSVRTPGHNSHGPEVFTCLLYFGGGDLLFVSFFLLLLVGFFFFFGSTKKLKKKSLPTFLQETKLPRKVRYGSLSIYRNRFWTSKRIIFFPSFWFYTREKKIHEISPEERGMGAGRGQELPKT